MSNETQHDPTAPTREIPRIHGDQPSTAVDGAVAREPEKLTLSEEAVADLLALAIRGAEGNAWWRGFVAAHGTPSWIVSGQWRIVPEGGAEVVRVPTRGERGER